MQKVKEIPISQKVQAIIKLNNDTVVHRTSREKYFS